MFERKHIRWISWILIIALLISGDFLGNPVSERTSAAENPVSYRNVIYTLDENNKDPQGIYYNISGDEAMVGDTSFGAADYQGAGDGIVIIPDAVSKDGNVYDVTNISSYAFNRCSKLREITVGDNVQKISEGAFSLSGLSKIHIGKQVQKIETSWLVPFEGTKLEEITIDPENRFYTVKDGVLFTTDMSELVRYPSQDTRTEYTIPDSVTKISQYAFESVRNVKNMMIPSGVEEIGAAAFEAATALYPVQDLRNVKRLGAMAFADVKNLRMILLGENLQIYMGKAYQNTNQIIIRSGIESLYLPGGTKTSYEVLNGCTGVKSVIFGKGMTLHRGDGAYCKELENIVLPEDLTEIPENFAKGCTSLKSIYIPETVTKIGENAFQDDTVVLYGKKDSVAESYAKEAGLTFQDIDEHVHQYEPYTFYEDEYVTITGMLCRECGHAYDCEQTLIKALPETSAFPIVTTSTPTVTPTATSTPSPPAGVTPSATPTLSPPVGVTPTATPTLSPPAGVTPTATPTLSPPAGVTPSATPTPSPPAGVTPSATPTLSPPAGVTPTATPTLSPPAGVTPSATPTAKPMISLNPTVSPQGSPAPSVLSTSMPDTDASAEPSERSDLSIAGLRVRSGDNRHVTLSWSYNMSATGYEIYMSSGKNKTYRRIQTLSGQTLSYTYNKQKAGVRYRYKLRAWWTDGSRIVYGAFTKPQTITVTRLITPVISVQKKRAGSIPYLLLRVKRYNADRVQLYAATNGGAYKKIVLKTNSIKKLHGIYRIRYQKGNKTFRIRIRTYRKRGKKRLFSYYSKPVKIKG
ncbi:fibronectin type III domain-containing protein [Jutongia huaianensis]|uniref:Leucine-rich repeat protein n=1 Tax=Jutongia huaianensis TaxID=2763668 RepID=A0ABR7N143_9FIRM|nr:leucine-rich repeat protein [Jutongia huaianensis]MBC8562349.1 leucine-rich repeat protein [Jutongia huaianensis]